MRRIVVCLRSCPTRLLGPYGCEWIETPNLDRLAAEGIVFDSHYATHIGPKIPSPSYAEKWQGFDAPGLNEALPRFAEQNDGFFYIEIDPFALPWGEWQEGPVDFTEEDTRDQFFVAATEMVTTFDGQIGAWLETLQQHGLEVTADLIVTAEMGLPAGEHGILGTNSSRLHEELVHLPLLVRFADRRLAGYRVAGFTTPDELKEVLATGQTERIESQILGNGSPRESVSTTLGTPPREMSLRTVDSCLILSIENNEISGLLFDRPDDRFEVNDLFTRQPDRVEELEKQLRERNNSESNES